MSHTADNVAITLITLGGLLLLGFVTDGIGRRTRLPRVTLMLIFGFIIGPSVLDLLPQPGRRWYPAIADMALVMIGFLLGETLSVSNLRRHGRLVLGISVSVVASTAAVVFGGLVLTGVPIGVALLLGGIAPATDPAATADVTREAGAKGGFSQTLLGVVAIDDAWGLIMFSVMLAAAQAVSGQGEAMSALVFGFRDLGGAVALGVALGVPMAYATGRVRRGEPTLAEALGLMFLCGGIALWLDVSYLLAAMVMGAAVANLARHHERPFHAIEGIEWPFMILFFILSGASLRVESLLEIGLIGFVYIALRAAGRLAGAWIGATASGGSEGMKRWMGVALMPQAGVALGMALLASQRMPEVKEVIMPVVIATTVFFEIIGPVLTKMALNRADKAP